MPHRALLAITLFTLPLPASADANVETLQWLSGTWEGGSDPMFEEQWSQPRGGVLMGFTRYFEGHTLRGFEFFRVQPTDDGALVLYAQPDGRTAVPFRLVHASDSSVTFENPAHDYPQRIRYSRDGDTLTATLSLIDGSEARDLVFRKL